MSKKSGEVAVRRQWGLRQGEGTLLEVTRSMSPLPGGQTAMQLSVDLSVAPVPDRRFIADVVSAVRQGGFAKLLFGQSKVDGSGLRALLVIQMSADAVHHFLSSMEEIEDQFNKLIGDKKVQKMSFFELKQEPMQTVELAANVVAASYSGHEACLDFMHVSAFATLYVQQGGKLAVDPVVRVLCPAGAFYAIWQYLEKEKDSFVPAQ